MKLASGILAFLLVTAALLAALISGRAQQPECGSQVVTIKGPAGQPLECVCFQGSVSTCFDPGP